MILNKRISKVKIITTIFILLIGCNLSAKTNFFSEKVFELDLTDKKISSEGGGIELEKNKGGCLLILSVYGETGQEKYKFKFKKNNLLSTSYFKYGYQNGLISIDDDLKEFIADDHGQENDGSMDLIVNKLFIGNENRNITKKFYTYKKKIPSKVLIRYCS